MTIIDSLNEYEYMKAYDIINKLSDMTTLSKWLVVSRLANENPLCAELRHLRLYFIQFKRNSGYLEFCKLWLEIRGCVTPEEYNLWMNSDLPLYLSWAASTSFSIINLVCILAAVEYLHSDSDDSTLEKLAIYGLFFGINIIMFLVTR